MRAWSVGLLLLLALPSCGHDEPSSAVPGATSAPATPPAPVAPVAPAAPATPASAAAPAGSPAAPAAAGTTLSVAAAASLRQLLESTQEMFLARHSGSRIVFSFDASSTLARQINADAPFDVFVSADAATMDLVADRALASTRREILGNRLALVGRSDLPDPPHSPADLRDGQRTLAVAGPAVPAGKYARAYLGEAGLLEALEPNFVNADSVTATLALVESGAADCGLVYLTDARAAKSARLLWTAPEGKGPAIWYVAAALRQATTPLAEEYVTWFGGREFVQAAVALGFLPPPTIPSTPPADR